MKSNTIALKPKVQNEKPKTRKLSWIIGSDEALQSLPALTKKIKPKNVSKKYSPVQTKEVHDLVTKHGWKLVKAAVANKAYKEAKHILVYNHQDYKTKAGDELRIIIMNSFNGTSSFKFAVGIFRTICTNGLVVCTKDFGSLQQRHMAINEKHLKEYFNDQLNGIPALTKKVEMFEKVILNRKQKLLLAKKMIEASSANKIFDINPESVLKTHRKEDRKPNLWTVFNTVQENLVKGNVPVVSKMTGKSRVTKPITNAFQDITQNQRYFEIATEFVR